MTPRGGPGRGQGRKPAAMTGKRVNVYLAADLVEWWKSLPIHEKSRLANQALRLYRKHMAEQAREGGEGEGNEDLRS